MRKYVALVLALLLVMSALLGTVACKDDTPDPGPDANGDESTNNGDGSGDGTQSDEDARIPLDYLPEADYSEDGQPRQFHILEWYVGGDIIWREGDVEEPDGSKLSEAVFARNAAVEERFGVEITSEYGAPETLLPLALGAGDDLYQLVTQRSLSLIPMITGDQFYDLNDYSQYIHTDMSWWVQGSIESFTIGDHLYVASSEMLLRDKGATHCTVFNKQMAELYDGMPDFYQLVRDKEWTIWEFAVAAETVSRSDDGDDLMNTENDIWGMSGFQDAATYLYIGAGYQFARVNVDGILEAEFGAVEDTVTVFSDIFETVIFPEWFYCSNTEQDLVQPTKDMFINDQALFTMYALIGLPNNMVTDYGVLPMPGYDESQIAENGYHSLVYMHGDSVVGIPTLTWDPEFSAIILEAISWESWYTVSPTFYDELLLTRWLRDKESVDMMEIILDTRTYDPGQFWGERSKLFDTIDGVVATCVKKNDPSIASMWATYGDAFQRALDVINDLAKS